MVHSIYQSQPYSPSYNQSLIFSNSLPSSSLSSGSSYSFSMPSKQSFNEKVIKSGPISLTLPPLQYSTRPQQNSLPPLANVLQYLIDPHRYTTNATTTTLPDPCSREALFRSQNSSFADGRTKSYPYYYPVNTTLPARCLGRDSRYVPANFINLVNPEMMKRPRRRYHEVSRLYKCTYPNCKKAYGALNHLNAHIKNMGHGNRRKAKEFSKHQI